MQAIHNWPAVLRKAWSVRLFLLSVLLQVADVLLSTWGSFSTSLRWSIWLQIAGVICAAAGLVARFVFQGGIHEQK
ncbi:hypothetical protein [Comamonas serinivorans]|uniref:hypothetical protein n=1 Tax=Comamonas serinivorans TaxID=1082851 RepID=UPI0012FA6F5A|nr:hypothetical protein [Comamonas serinivorans]